MVTFPLDVEFADTRWDVVVDVAHVPDIADLSVRLRSPQMTDVDWWWRLLDWW